jgi:predicted permease
MELGRIIPTHAVAYFIFFCVGAIFGIQVNLQDRFTPFRTDRDSVHVATVTNNSGTTMHSILPDVP